jgi:dipeptidyl aminopeptidase/acylaminoacyl peptidase
MTPFHDLQDYVAIPRVTALRLSPDGSWLAAAVQTLAPGGKKYLTSIWRIDPAGEAKDAAAGPRKLTCSAEGEDNPRFLPDGSLLFISKRPGAAPGSLDGRTEGAAASEAASLWMLPAAGGEARRVVSLPGGIAGAEAASGTGIIVLASPVLRGAGTGDGTSTAEDDARLRKAREEAGVTAILHESVPVRYWDHDLGPGQLRLFAADTGDIEGRMTAADLGHEKAAGPGGADGAKPDGLRDLTPGPAGPGRALDEQPFEVTPDGTAAVTGWWLWDGAVKSRAELAVIDVATGQRQALLSAPGFDFSRPRVSPDGRFVACLRTSHDTWESPRDVTIVLAPLPGPAGAGPGGAEPGGAGSGGSEPGGTAPGGGRDLLPGFDRWPAELAWAPDSLSVYFTADDHGRRPVFRVDTGSGEVARITADDGAYTDLNPSPDGRCLYALRSSVDEPPTPVRLDAAGELDAAGAAGAPGERGGLEEPGGPALPGGHGRQQPVRLAAPGTPVELPGHLEEMEATADDGTPVRSWLVVPETASASTPAPLLLWVHGGPMMSWNSWSWRWNPWLMAARGYAVLLPDPALSSGYGHQFIARGYHQWGPRPFADVMAATDAAVARPDIDASRTAMMGGSYGGYMANWIAGHTDRFRAIVSHAGLWVLEQMFGTTDHPMFWRPQFGDPLTEPGRYELNSPHRHVASIRTPMLVIHGNKDYRVPVGEALRLWWDLARHGADAKFLYFPDENHWILGPGHAILWYETVLAFLAHHLHGKPWRRPALL